MTTISNEKIQDYIDGRLSEQDEAAMAAFLLANPDKAIEIQELRQQNEALKGVGAEILSEPIPQRLKDIVERTRQQEEVVRHRQSHKRGFQEGLSLAATLVVGMLTGWITHGYFQTPYPTAGQLALQSARDAYLFYGTEKKFPVEFGVERDADFGDWLKSAFNMTVGRPDLDQLGYTYVGARVLPWPRGRMGLYLYENKVGDRAALMFWPSEEAGSAQNYTASFKDILTSIIPGDGLEYALICDKKNKDFDRIAETVGQHIRVPGT